jgi:hypothetical protein
MTSTVDPLWPVDDGLPKRTDEWRAEQAKIASEITALHNNTGPGRLIDGLNTTVTEDQTDPDNRTYQVDVVIPPASGEANTLSDVSPGAGDESIVSGKVGVDLQVKDLIGGSGVSLSSGPNSITISAASVAGEANTATNIGANSANGPVAGKVGVDLQFKGLNSSDGSLSISPASDTIDLTVVNAGAPTTATYLLSGSVPGELTNALQFQVGEGLSFASATVEYDLGDLADAPNINESNDHLLYETAAGTPRRISPSDLSVHMRPPVWIITASGNTTIDLSRSNYFVIDLLGNTTLTGFTNLPASGIAAPIYLRIAQPANANYSCDLSQLPVTWDGGTPTVTQVNGASDMFSIMIESGAASYVGFRAGSGAVYL